MVKVATVAGSEEERVRSLRRMRPHFSQPKGVTFLRWQKHVDSLLTLGLWDIVVQRLADSGYSIAVEQGKRALVRLREMERMQVVSAITGEGYETLWERDAKRNA